MPRVQEWRMLLQASTNFAVRQLRMSLVCQTPSKRQISWSLRHKCDVTLANLEIGYQSHNFKSKIDKLYTAIYQSLLVIRLTKSLLFIAALMASYLANDCIKRETHQNTSLLGGLVKGSYFCIESRMETICTIMTLIM